MSIPCRPRLLILDCDGVLIRSERANLAYYNHLFHAFGLPRVEQEDSDSLRLLHTLSTPQVIEVFFPEAVRAEALAFAGRVGFSPFLPYLEAEPGWAETLPQIRKRMPVAVATNRGASAREVLGAVGLISNLDLIVTIRDVERPKPYPDLLLRVLQHFRVAAADAVYVGDSDLDRKASEAAGTNFLGFRTSIPPDAESPEEVEAYLTELA